MAGKSLTLLLKILADATNAQKGLGSLDKSVAGVQSTRAGLAIPTGIAFAAVGTFALGTAQAASEAEQSLGGVDAVFKDNADTVKTWADDSAQAVGLSSTAYRNMATVLGSQLKNMGTDVAALAPKTNDLIGLGADLAAQYGGNTSDAVAALSSLLRGERDPIERYGVSIKQADIEAQKAAMGLSGLEGEADKTATTQATLALLTKQTADAQGAFARETDTAAHAQQVANAEWSNATAQLGQAFLPALLVVSQVLGQVARFVQENSTLVGALAVVIGVAAGAILAINVAFKAWTLATQAMTIAQGLLNAVMALNPIGLVIIAIIALVAALVLLWNKSEAFRAVVTAVFNAVVTVVKFMVDVTIGYFRLYFTILSTIFRAIWFVIEKPIRAFGALVQSVVGLVAAVFRLLVRTVSGLFATLASVLSGPINAFLGLVQTVLGTVGGLFRTAASALATIMAAVGKTLAKPFNDFLSVVRSVVGAVKGLIKGVADWVADKFRAISGVLDKISGAIDSIPFIGSRSVAPAPGPAPHLLAGRAAGAGIPTGGGGRQTLTLVLDREVFGRATVSSVRRFDRRNGPAQLIPTWS
jgi:phage-related protein